MKRTVSVIILLLGLISGVFSQSSGPVDLMLVLDTSASMSGSYRETSDYLIGPFLREFLRIGDTFHLISFSRSPRLEISRRIEGVGDVETIIARMLLLYPLDPETDLGGALNFSEQYSSSLSGGKPKKIVLVSDGDAPNTQNLIDEAQARLRGQGAELQFIRVPVTGSGPSSGRQAQAAASPQPTLPAQTAASPQTGTAAPSSPRTSPQTGQGAGSQTSSQTGQGAVSQLPSQSSPAQTGTGTSPQQGLGTGTSSPSQGASQRAENQGQGTTASPQTTLPAQTATSPQTGTAAPSSPQTSPQTGQGAVSQLPSQSSPAQTGTGTSPQQGQGQGQGTGTSSSSQGASQTAGNQGQSTQTTQTPTTQTGQSTGAQQTAPARQTPESSGSSTQPPAQSPAAFQPGGLPLPLLIGLGLLALLILALLIFLLTRRLHNSPNQAMAKAAAPADNRDAELMGDYAEAQRKTARPPLQYRSQEPKPMPKDKVYNEAAPSDGPVMLNLFVADQNTAIGRRNIHTVKSGYTFSVGGGKSDFLIFLVPFPPHIADVQYDGRNCTFIPRKPKYFPDIGQQPVPACIGKNIRMVSDKNYEIHLRIERYEDPLTALNKMLHSISVPGPA